MVAKQKRSQDHGDYTAGHIQVPKGLEAGRKRPGMYSGSTSARGTHPPVYEVLAHSIAGATAGTSVAPFARCLSRFVSAWGR